MTHEDFTDEKHRVEEFAMTKGNVETQCIVNALVLIASVLEEWVRPSDVLLP